MYAKNNFEKHIKHFFQITEKNSFENHFLQFIFIKKKYLKSHCDLIFQNIFKKIVCGIPLSLPLQRSGNVALIKVRRLSPQLVDALVCLITVEMQYRQLVFLRQSWTHRESVRLYFIVNGV